MNKLLVLIVCFFVSFSSAITAPLFKNWKKYPVDDGPFSVIPADVDSDGDVDLVVGYVGNDWDSDTVISVLKNNGDATFAARNDFQTGETPFKISNADLDDDGDIDLVVTYWDDYSSSDSTVSILKNNGDGTFASRVNYGVGASPISIFCSDLDGDRDADVAVANFESATVSILKNRGDGTFETKVDYALGVLPAFLSGSDLDLDSDMDLVIASGPGGCSGKLVVLKNYGDGTFGIDVSYPMPSPHSLFASDLDNDGLPDMAVANAGYACFFADSLSILKNDGNGTFTLMANYGGIQDAYSVIGSDLDGDGDTDLAVADYGYCDPWHEHCVIGDFISVFLNNGDGTFVPESTYATGYDPASICAADFDGDEDVDLAVANYGSNQIQIFLNTSNPTKGDVNGDGTFAFTDLVSLLNCVFFGTGGCNRYSSDVNCDGRLTFADLVLEINKFYLGNPFPC